LPRFEVNQRLKSVLVVLALIAALGYSALQNQNSGQSGKSQPSQDTSGNFDFYVLSLSWSPTFCAEQSGGDDKEQCGTGRPFAFVVHGLWPQNERGFPSDCQSQFGDRIERSIADNMLDIMPSRDLVFHEWRKHGTCSGLSPEDYFALARKARSQVTIPRQYAKLNDYMTVAPAEVERAFIGANPKLQQNEIAVTCSNRYLKEVRVCFDKALNFRPCPEIDSNACRAAKTIMPPVRN
jgi:ribonuclease T2